MANLGIVMVWPRWIRPQILDLCGGVVNLTAIIAARFVINDPVADRCLDTTEILPGEMVPLLRQVIVYRVNF